MPLGFSDLLVVQTSRTEITLCPCREEGRQVNDYRAIEKVHYQLHNQLRALTSNGGGHNLI